MSDPNHDPHCEGGGYQFCGCSLRRGVARRDEEIAQLRGAVVNAAEVLARASGPTVITIKADENPEAIAALRNLAQAPPAPVTLSDLHVPEQPARPWFVWSREAEEDGSFIVEARDYEEAIREYRRIVGDNDPHSELVAVKADADSLRARLARTERVSYEAAVVDAVKKLEAFDVHRMLGGRADIHYARAVIRDLVAWVGSLKL